MKTGIHNSGGIKLWQRLLLVVLVGAVPLFIVSLALIKVIYGDALDFTLQERRCVAFQRPLEQLLDLLPRHQAAARQATAGDASANTRMAELQREIDLAIKALAANYRGDMGRKLKFTDADLASRKRDHARLPVLLAHWQRITNDGPAVTASGDVTGKAMDSVRAMIVHTGDLSNLILDSDLDSYYMMDATLNVIPRTQQRLSDIILQVGQWLRNRSVASQQFSIALMSSRLRTEDQERVINDAQIALNEDRNFHGISESLQKSLPPALENYTNSNQMFIAALDRINAGQQVSVEEFETAGWKARAACLNLWQVGAGELDRLLEKRQSAIGSQRLRAHSVIIVTLALAAIAMGWIIRGLLNSHYAEMIAVQEELRSKEARLRAMGDNLPESMIYQVVREHDGSMRFQYVSAGVERLHGLPVEAVLRDSTLLYRQITDEDRPRVRAAHDVSEKTMGVFNVIARMRRADGEVRWLHLDSAPRRLPDGRVIWDGVETDVTERKRAEEELRRLNRALKTFSHCNQVLVHATTERDLLSEICRVIVESGGYRTTWVGFVEHDEQKTIRPVAYAGTDGGDPQELNLTWADTERGQGLNGTAIRTGQAVVCHDLADEPTVAPWRAEVIRRGLRSALVLPLRSEQEVFGSLSIYSTETDAFDDAEIRLLTELADDLAYGIQALRALDQRQSAEGEVRRLLNEAEKSRSALLSILEDQKQTEEALRSSEDRFRSALQHSPIGMALVAPEGRWLEVNPALCQIFGYSREELLATDFQTLTHREDLPSLRAD